MDPSTYSTKRNLINALFSKNSKFTNRLTRQSDTLKILRVLKANGLLHLSYDSVKDMVVTFDTKGSPLLSLRIINDTLGDLGYNNYLTKSISKHEDTLSWSISIKANHMLDPVEFSKKMVALGCQIRRIQRSGEFYWNYKIDTKNGVLKTIPISLNERKSLRKPNHPYWVKVYGASKAQLVANSADNWFPKIVFFDRFLKPLEELNESVEKKSLNIPIPQTAFYMKISDKFKLDNIRRGLTIRLR